MFDGALAAEIERRLREEHLGAAGGDRDDAAAVSHTARCFLKHEERALGIGAEDMVEIGFGCLGQRLDDGDADIGNHDVDRAELTLSLVKQAMNIRDA
ncbi:hypothetical protein X768_16080 [Mesorhizobium sp. LSJC265A00]|uniref:hypothetical protein n=1 Tax=Mesorhizobium sp. LSJC265A00 TaxID=1287322 RepID=UPI0003CE5571|nr:hypothetical protein [Mesorhizobium sp. LSJC265A00]ESX10154.1 hypothetical protein X768_16080 [Mesorhizobium sp. LSJC265A00]